MKNIVCLVKYGKWYHVYIDGKICLKGFAENESIEAHEYFKRQVEKIRLQGNSDLCDLERRIKAGEFELITKEII